MSANTEFIGSLTIEQQYGSSVPSYQKSVLSNSTGTAPDPTNPTTATINVPILNINSDTNTTFSNAISGASTTLKQSVAYGNLNKLNCRTCHIRTETIASDGYVADTFTGLSSTYTNQVIDARIAVKLSDLGSTTITTTGPVNIGSLGVYNSETQQYEHFDDLYVKYNDTASKYQFNTADGTPALINNNLRVNGNLQFVSMSLYSDQRLKENIVKLTDEQVDVIIDNLNVYSFNFIDDKNNKKQKHYGVIAQEVQPIAPELVNANNDDYLTVNYNDIFALLIKKVQQLTNLNKQFEARISALEAKTNLMNTIN